MTLPLGDASQPLYLCPGESQPVSRSVHLARVAAGWAVCGRCTHRLDSAELPAQALAALTENAPGPGIASDAVSLRITVDGFRGRYQTEVSRTLLEQLVPAVLALLEWPTNHRIVCAGRDHRRHSPDLSLGVLQSLVSCGFSVVDYGQVSHAAIDAVLQRERDLQLAVFITGSGGSAADGGVDLCFRESQQAYIPWERLGRVIGRAAAALGPVLSVTGESAGESDESNSAKSDAASDVPLHLLSRLRSRSVSGETGIPQPASGKRTARRDLLDEPGASHVQLVRQQPTSPSSGTGERTLYLQSDTLSSTTACRPGTLRSGQSAEQVLRDAIARWIPSRLPQGRRVIVGGSLSESGSWSRLEWLCEHFPVILKPVWQEASLRGGTSAFGQDGGKPQLCLTMPEDDRILYVGTGSGQSIDVVSLAAWLMQTLQETELFSGRRVVFRGDAETCRVIIETPGAEGPERIANAWILAALILRAVTASPRSLERLQQLSQAEIPEGRD